MRKLIKNKKSQAWSMDIMVAVGIFIMAIVVFYIYSLNRPDELKENFENLFQDGKIITDNLLSEGYPDNWENLENIEEILKIGLLTDGKIDEVKLDAFRSFTENDINYQKTKKIFNTKYDYYFFLNDESEGIGKPGIDNSNKENINTENLVKITRFTIYENKPVTAYLYIWE